MISARLFVAALLLVGGGAGYASGENRNPAALVDAVIACGDISDTAARLACFDAHVAELRAARQQNARLFQDRPAVEQPQFTEIRSTLTAVAPLELGTFLLVLADHSVWQTADIVRFEPDRGDPIRITRGTLGGYVAAIGVQHSIRVRRIR